MSVLERRLYFHIDWALIASIIALSLIGLAMIYSSTYNVTTNEPSRIYYTQIYALVIGLVAMTVMLAIDYRSLADKSHVLYLGLIVALVAVMLFGSTQMGAKRWLDLGFYNLQPSEFSKFIVALVLAKLLGDSRRQVLSNNELFLGAVLTAIPVLLILQQPDLGTAVTLLPILLVVTFAAGLPVKYLAVLGVIGILTAPVAWQFALKDYQKERIETFLDPELDPKGAGYQQIQARVTVGSGGLWGKGFRQGTQGQLRFLPVAHNDFIFSVLAEEQGFVGVIVALGLYLFVIMRALEAAKLAKDRLGAYLVLGVLATFTFQVIYNITMSAGLAPVKGLTLPLMSYGGSSLIATLAGFGLILNVRMRRFTN
jgi:rod shape determining protein RodA